MACRNEGTPPWTFVVVEVTEESNLPVAPDKIVVQCVHHQTGRTMIYTDAWLTNVTQILVGDADEVAEVRWVSLAEANELQPDMYRPVRSHLARQLRT